MCDYFLAGETIFIWNKYCEVNKHLAQIAVERGCGRLGWWCLDWNQRSIDFYLSMGAEPMKDWTVYRIDGDILMALASVD